MEEERLKNLIKAHNEYRESSINLIPSENKISRNASECLSGDLASRYGNEWYGGSKYAIEIYEEATELARKLFNVKYAFVSPLSGNICDLAVIFSFTKPDDEIAIIPKENGGYPLGYKKFHRKEYAIPMNGYEIDVGRIKEREIPLVLLAPSVILFPLPLETIKMKFHGVHVYDASHVLGLIAGGEFQKPLKEGMDIMIGSTHKTFPGPQGGIVLTNNTQLYEKLHDYLMFDFESGIGLIDNMHMNRIACLSIVMEEMRKNGKKYARQIVKNAKVLARNLHENGIKIRYPEKGFTMSHQIILDMDRETAYNFFKNLEKNRIFIDRIGRIGVAEVTHIGMKEEEMEMIAEMIVSVFRGEIVKEKAIKMAKEFYSKF